MTESEFMKEQQAAIDRMREASAKSKMNNTVHKMPPVPSFVKMPQSNNPVSNNFKQKEEKPTDNMGFSLLNNVLKDNDSVLIIGLLLILLSENADKKLLFALVYILL